MELKAVNWNKKEDDFSLAFWKQNIRQFWVDEEFIPSDDKDDWVALDQKTKETFKKVLGGLTFLDTKQGGQGMPLVLLHTEGGQRKSVLAFMGAMEEIHAKSYSNIFTTIATEQEIDEIFEWTDTYKPLQKKGKLISDLYLRLLKRNVSKEELYMAYVASVFLESYLFYSGFFLPLWLAGQGKMVACGEIINLILRDESIHGVYVGLLAQDLWKTFTPEEQKDLAQKVEVLLLKLHENEIKYTKEVYKGTGLENEVLDFIEYNANKAMQLLGFNPYFAEKPINPIVLNGLNTETKNHDFFSVKGNGYVMATNVVKLSDDDFIF